MVGPEGGDGSCSDRDDLRNGTQLKEWVRNYLDALRLLHELRTDRGMKITAGYRRLMGSHRREEARGCVSHPGPKSDSIIHLSH
jgi:hypothetical protein